MPIQKADQLPLVTADTPNGAIRRMAAILAPVLEHNNPAESENAIGHIGFALRQLLKMGNSRAEAVKKIGALALSMSGAYAEIYEQDDGSAFAQVKDEPTE